MTTDILTELGEGGKLSFKAVHIHDKGTAGEIVFDKALDATVNSSISEAGNYIVTVENPMDDSDEQVSLIYARADVILCLNGKDCSGSAVMIVDDKTVEIYDHADGDGNYKGNLEAIIAYSGNLIINGGNYGGIQGNDGSITFNSGTVSDFVSAYPSTEDVTINVNGGIICRITGREENSSDLTINLNGSPVITGNGSYTAGDFNSTAHILLGSGVVLDIVDGFNGSGENGEKITVQFYNYVNSAYVTHEITPENDNIVFAQGTDLSGLVDTFAYYDSSRNVSVKVSEDGKQLSFHLETITVDNGDGTTTKVEAIDKDNDGIYEDEEGNEVYIPTPDDNDNNYIEVKPEEEPSDGIYEDEAGNKYIPVDTDNDGKVDDSLTDTNKDGIFEDEKGNKYLPDQDGDGDPEKVEDKDNDGFLEDEKGNKYLPDQNGDGEADKVTDDDGDGVYEDEDGNKYLPDQDGDGEPEEDSDKDGIFEGSGNDDDEEPSNDNFYVPDGNDDDEDPDKVTDDDGDGVYEDEEGNKYIPDQDGDEEAEKDSNNDGIFEGSKNDDDPTDADDTHYVPDGDDDDKDPEKVTDKDEDGVYEDEEGNKYIPDQDGDGEAEPDTDDDGIFEGTKGENAYIPDGDDEDTKPEVVTPNPDGSITDDDGNNYLPDKDGDGEVEPDTDKNGIYEGSKNDDDEEPSNDNFYGPDGEKVVENGNGSYTEDEDGDGKADKGGNTYLPDQDGDGEAELVTPNVDGSYTDNNGTTDPADDKVYISDGKGGFTEVDLNGEDHYCPSKLFRDLNVSLWYHQATDYALNRGMMEGYGNGIFGPNDNLNRAMMVQILYNLEGRPEVSSGKVFDDVAAGAWYADAVNWAAANGIVEGYGNGKFGPLDDMTREQMAAMVYRYVDYKDGDVTARGDLSVFTDGNKTSNWALDEMRWAIGVGLLEGKGNNILDPVGTATRAEVATILMNYCKKCVGA